jgi:hypothetical protein
MRSIRLLVLAVAATTSFTACSTVSVAQLRERYPMPDCPSLEGYPDCQDGFRVLPNPVTAGDRPASERVSLPQPPAQTP